MANRSQEELQRVANRASSRSADRTRHHCFVSYHVADTDEVEEFLDRFGHVMIPTVVGVTAEDDFVDSENTDYIMNRIRQIYLGSTTVTIVLVGACTWARKFVDWEVYSSLRSYQNYAPSGLMAVTLPSVSDVRGRKLPARVDDNVDGEQGYARWWKYPATAADLQSQIQTAFDYRTSRGHLINNSRPRRVNNVPCP